jgi:hypothetical protein
MISKSDPSGYWAGSKKPYYVLPHQDTHLSTSTVLVYDPYAQILESTSTESVVVSSINTVPYSISSWLMWYKITSHANGSSYTINLPPQWRILQLANGYLLGLDGSKAYIVNPKTKQAAFFADLPVLEKRVVSIP